MPGMPAADQALEYARTRPDLSFGVHLTFVRVGSERPLADPATIPDLLGADDRFLPTGTIRKRALLHRLPVDQLERELEAQIAFVRDAGVPVSHVDSHNHVHKLGPFPRVLRSVLPRFGITRVRTVQDIYLTRPLTSATYWLGPVWRRPLARGFATTDHLYMPAESSSTDWPEPLLRRARTLSGTLEIGVHPGVDGWQAAERAAAERMADAAVADGHSLISWHEVGG
jgi:chitin disaccharide deacetylase